MRILIIEDEFSLSDVLAAALKKENFVTGCSYDGEDGYLQAMTGIYDAIILDIMLPNMRCFRNYGWKSFRLRFLC